MAIDPAEHTVTELKEELTALEDPAEVESVLEAEREGKNRTTAERAIQRRLDELESSPEETAGDGSADESANDGSADAESAGGGNADESAGDGAEDDETAGESEEPELPLVPAEYDISELGPELQDVEDVAALEAILESEEAGEDRPPVTQLIESRIEKFADDEGADAGEVDPGEHTPAELGNLVTDIDDVADLERLLEREREGENRDSAVRLIESRIDSVAGSDEDEEIEERAPPEERHPELDHPTADKRHVRAIEDGTYRDMWVYCETQAGGLIDVSREMLGKARELIDDYNAEYEADERVIAVLIGDDVADLAEECIACGADAVVVHEDERLGRFRHKPYTEIFADMARWGGDPGEGNPDPADWRDYDEPRYVLFPATHNGRDLSAQVQGELDSGLASDCSGLYIDDVVISNPAKTGQPGTNKTFERVLHMKRPDFSGFEYSTILSLDNPGREFHPQGGSVIPGSFEVPDPDPEREGEVIEHDLDLEDDWFRVDVTQHDQLDEGIDLTGHDVVVAMGRGIGDDPTRGMELAEELADQFEDSEIGVSRGIVTGSYNFDAHVEKYTREERQIGETGQVVEPDLYIAAGISGAVQHKVGCDESDTIVAINTDPDARIYDWSDYFVEGDLFEVLPQLITALEETDEPNLEAAVDGGAAADAPDERDGGATDERGETAHGRDDTATDESDDAETGGNTDD